MSKKFYIKLDKPIEIGDLVRCVRDDGECKPGDIRKVSQLGISRDYIFYTFGSKKPRWQGAWEPVRKGIREIESRRAEMQKVIGEMLVELLDKEERNEHPCLLLTNYRKLDNSIGINPFDGQRYEAKLAPNDTWDTLTGVYVALSKAAGRKLPDWIYGEER